MTKLTRRELALFERLSTPAKIQDFLDRLPRNHEKRGDTCYSPRQVIREKKAHCIEGACLAAAALWYHGEPPLLLDLKANSRDLDHVVALYRKNGYWGAISKSEHVSLRWRDPVYRTVRELALSYFHEYFVNDTGEKTLVSYSRPLNLKRFGLDWITDESGVLPIGDYLDGIRHYSLVPRKNWRFIRPASVFERRAGRLLEWGRRHPKT